MKSNRKISRSNKGNGLRRTSINRTPISRRPSSMQRKELVARSRLKKTLLQECGDLCMTCGGTGFPFGLTLSHIIPLSRGGKTTRKNCLIECISCHNLRHGIKEK